MLSSYRDPRRSTTTYAAALESLENDILDWNGEVLKRDYPLAYALLASDPAPESYIHIRLRALLRLHPTTKLDSALLSTHPGSNQFKLILPARPPLVYHTFDHRHGPRLLRYLNANQEGVREERDDIWSWAVWAKSNGWRLLQEYIVSCGGISVLQPSNQPYRSDARTQAYRTGLWSTHEPNVILLPGAAYAPTLPPLPDTRVYTLDSFIKMVCVRVDRRVDGDSMLVWPHRAVSESSTSRDEREVSFDLALDPCPPSPAMTVRVVSSKTSRCASVESDQEVLDEEQEVHMGERTTSRKGPEASGSDSTSELDEDESVADHVHAIVPSSAPHNKRYPESLSVDPTRRPLDPRCCTRTSSTAFISGLFPGQKHTREEEIEGEGRRSVRKVRRLFTL